MAKRSLIEVFNDDFVREITQARNYPEAYEIASEKFERQHGFAAFDSYDSFRLKKTRRLRKG